MIRTGGLRLGRGSCLIGGFLALLLLRQPAAAQVLRIDEAEKCKITCKAGKDPGEKMWASGGKHTPPFWGLEPGDSIEWEVQPEKDFDDLKLAVRYAYAAQAYRDSQHAENPDRVLHLTIDGGEPIKVSVPDTGWWEIYQTTHVALPPLKAGTHVFKLTSPATHSSTDVDCFIFYRGKPERITPNLRGTILATSPSKHFVIRVTPKARMKMTPDLIFKHFERIYDLYEKQMGWTPPTPVGINIIEDDKWPNPGATAFQNGYGVFFRAGVMNTEQGNWCHEMTHMFYVAHFPQWFDESSVRTLTIMNWVPTLFPKHRRPEDDPAYRQCAADGRKVLDNPTQEFDDINAIQCAIRVKYGKEVFSKFFHACAEAGNKKQLDFTPGHHLNKNQIVKYMSQAAGEDVGPIYRQWKGFKDAP